MKYAAATVLVLFGLTACSGPGEVSPSGGLLYQVPDASPVVYVWSSSANVDIDAGPAGSIGMDISSDATVSMAFADAPEGVQVTAVYEDLNASVSNPMGGSETATEADIEGNLVFTLDPKGKGTVVSEPELKGAAESLANPVTLVHGFFPRLPGGAAAPGDMWTDTISLDVSVSTGDESTTSVVTYTLQGDTVVDGATLVYVTYEGTGESVGVGSEGGFEVTRTMSGDFTGMFLWDPARSLYVEGSSESEMSGMVEVAGAGMPAMPMTMKASDSVKIQGG